MSNGAPRISGRLAAQPLEPVIIQSWQRSEATGLARDQAPVFRRVPADELQRRQSANHLLLEVAIPHLRWLSRYFHDRPHVAYIVDKDGIVLHAEGDRDAVDRFGLSPGHDWSEAVMGTNGAGTALASGAPVAVIGCDHWSTAWKDATCLGAPIPGSDGTPCAAIDISMDVRDGDAERLVLAAHVAYTIGQELARHEAEATARATEAMYATMGAALEAEQRARADAEAALARAQAAESALRVSEHWLQTIIDSTPAVVYVVDTEGRFLLFNRRVSEQFGTMDPAEVVGRSTFDYFPREIAETLVANNRRVLESRQVCEFEEVVEVGGQIHTFIAVKAPLYDANGVPYAICGVSTDITERKRLSSALELAHRQKDAFIATVAHELRQPLGAIQAALALMQMRLGAEDDNRARDVVERQVGHLSRMVEDLLDAARIVQGKVALRRERITLRDPVEAALAVVRPIAREREQEVSVELPSQPVWLEADPARLQQVFSNLLTNAVKFTGRGGRITLSAEPQGDTVAVRVRDTGRGIPPELMPRIFDMFAQESSGARGGLGIGLAVVRGLVERHGGSVDARSDGPDRGSEFVVRLPTVASD